MDELFNCPVPGCGNSMPGHYAICSKHFAMLGRGIRDRIRKHYRARVVAGLHPTPQFQALIQEAVAKVVAAERKAFEAEKAKWEVESGFLDRLERALERAKRLRSEDMIPKELRKGTP